MRIPPALAASVLHLVYRGLCGTLRVQEENRHTVDQLDAHGERCIFCMWHDELFPLLRVKRQLNAVAVVSPSRDGDLLAMVMKKLKFHTVRGSSTRGGTAALLNAAKMMLAEHIHACITVDGPLGPRHKAKNGAFFLAHHADAFIVPIRVIMENAHRFQSWDRFQLPLPLSKVRVIFGEPWKPQASINGEMDDSAMAEARARLENDMERLAPGQGDPA